MKDVDMVCKFVHHSLMVICFDASKEAKRALDALLETGQFRDLSEAISMSLVNYEVLQNSVSKTGEVVTSDRLPPAIVWRPPAEPGPPSPIPKTKRPPAVTVSDPNGPEIPKLFILKTATYDGPDLLAVSAALEEPAEQLPPARWLFGQYNRFLPVKATCRALLNLLQRQSGGVLLNEAVEQIAEAAWLLGDYLYHLDQQAGHSREDSLAAAFPTTAGNGAVSSMRFAKQFVGDLRQPKQVEGQPKEMKFTGFPVALKLLGCTDGKYPILSLTTSGAEFALLPNPILDGSSGPVLRKFSEAEIAYLLAHIHKAVPEEVSAFAVILDAIENGSHSPDSIDMYLRQRFDMPEEGHISKTFLTTQRTGAISRMVDLGLIARAKEGLRVTYTVTESGRQFHDRANEVR